MLRTDSTIARRLHVARILRGRPIRLCGTLVALGLLAFPLLIETAEGQGTAKNRGDTQLQGGNKDELLQTITIPLKNADAIDLADTLTEAISKTGVHLGRVTSRELAWRKMSIKADPANKKVVISCPPELADDAISLVKECDVAPLPLPNIIVHGIVGEFDLGAGKPINLGKPRFEVADNKTCVFNIREGTLWYQEGHNFYVTAKMIAENKVQMRVVLETPIVELAYGEKLTDANTRRSEQTIIGKSGEIVFLHFACERTDRLLLLKAQVVRTREESRRIWRQGSEWQEDVRLLILFNRNFRFQ